VASGDDYLYSKAGRVEGKSGSGIRQTRYEKIGHEPIPEKSRTLEAGVKLRSTTTAVALEERAQGLSASESTGLQSRGTLAEDIRSGVQGELDYGLDWSLGNYECGQADQGVN